MWQCEIFSPRFCLVVDSEADELLVQEVPVSASLSGLIHLALFADSDQRWLYLPRSRISTNSRSSRMFRNHRVKKYGAEFRRNWSICAQELTNVLVVIVAFNSFLDRLPLTSRR